MSGPRPRSILITGGAGFIGSHLAQRLLEFGHQVTVLDNLSTGREENINHLLPDANFRYVNGSVLDEKLVGTLIKEADLVYHLAAAVGVKFVIEHLVDTLETNTRGTENVLRAAQQRGGQKVVLASTSEVYGKSKSFPHKEDDALAIGPPNVGRWGYACSKILDEFLALAYYKEKGLPVVILRIFNTVGPCQSASYGMVLPSLVYQAMHGEPMAVYGDGKQTRCFAYVGDVVKAMIDISQVERAQGEVFNVGSDHEVTIGGLAALVRETLESTSPIKYVPYESVYGSEFDEVHRRVPDLSKIQRYIDYRPSRDLAGIIQQVANALGKPGEAIGRSA